jgi:hypothetical protein
MPFGAFSVSSASTHPSLFASPSSYLPGSPSLYDTTTLGHKRAALTRNRSDEHGRGGGMEREKGGNMGYGRGGGAGGPTGLAIMDPR